MNAATSPTRRIPAASRMTTWPAHSHRVASVAPRLWCVSPVQRRSCRWIRSLPLSASPQTRPSPPSGRCPPAAGCAQTLVAAAASSNPAVTAAALVSRRCPPSHRRATADSTTNPAGTVSWAQRGRPRVGLLRSLASSQSARWAAAANGPCWPMLAVALSDDPDPDIGWAAMSNPCMEPHMFARSVDIDTRYAAALNPSCSRDLLELLLCDNDFQTRHHAAEWVSRRRGAARRCSRRGATWGIAAAAAPDQSVAHGPRKTRVRSPLEVMRTASVGGAGPRPRTHSARRRSSEPELHTGDVDASSRKRWTRRRSLSQRRALRRTRVVAR